MSPLSKLFSVGLLLVAASGLASAAQFTDAHEDGAYFITKSETGDDVFEKLDDSLELPDGLHPSRQIRARYKYLPSGAKPSCDGLAVDEQDFYSYAYDKFWFWCSNKGNEKLGKGIYAVKTSDTATFMCNNTPNPCNVNEWWEAVDTIGKKCTSRNQNWISGGWVQVDSWHKSYGFTDVHSKFCE